MEFRLSAFSTRDLSSAAFLDSLGECLSSLAMGPLKVLDSRRDRDEWLPLDDLGATAKEAIYKAGGVSICSFGDELTCRLNWRKYRSLEEIERLSATARALQNDLYLTWQVDEAGVEAHESTLVGAVRCLAVMLRPNLLFGFAEGQGSFETNFGIRQGLQAGLQDIYTLNVFGAAFVNAMGSARLESAPADVVQKLGESILLVPRSDCLRVSIADLKGARDRVRAHIGPEYFVSESLRGPTVEVRGLWSLLRTLRADSRGRQWAGEAVRRPEIDWSELLEV